MKTVPSEDDVERCVSENFQKSVSILPRFLHRRAAGNMEPLTGGDAGMIRMGDRWLLILVRGYFKKVSGRGFQKARFWTLDDDSHAENFSGGGATLLRFLHRRVTGNMEPLTGGDAGRIRMSDRWPLILMRSKFKKSTEMVSKKLEFGHLRVKGENDDDDLYAENFLEVVSFSSIFPM